MDDEISHLLIESSLAQSMVTVLDIDSMLEADTYHAALLQVLKLCTLLSACEQTRYGDGDGDGDCTRLAGSIMAVASRMCGLMVMELEIVFAWGSIMGMEMEIVLDWGLMIWQWHRGCVG